MNRRQKYWAWSSTLTLLLCLSALAASGPKAKTLYERGQAAEAKDDPITAYEDYYQAFQKEPKNLRYKTAYERLRFTAAAAHVTRGEKLAAQGDITGALTEYLRALEIDPSNELAHQDIEHARNKLGTPKPNQETSIPENKAEELTQVGSPVQLKPISNEPLTLHMTEDSKVVYQTVGKAAGINVLFDPEYTSKRIQVDIANVSLLDALRIVGVSSGTFWHPVTANTIFVAMNTRAKRQELEEEAVQTFYLANTAQQNDLNDIQTALRNLLVNAKLYGVPSQSAIVMRATPDELLLAQKLINDLDKSRPEVVVDVALLEVNRDKTRTIGVQLPGTFGLYSCSLPTPPAPPAPPRGTTTTGTTTTGNHDQQLDQPDVEQSCPPERYEFCGHHRAGNGQLAALGFRHQGSAKPQYPGDRWAEGRPEDWRTHSGGHRLLPDGRRDGGGQLAGEHAVHLSGCRCRNRDYAGRALRP